MVEALPEGSGDQPGPSFASRTAVPCAPVSPTFHLDSILTEEQSLALRIIVEIERLDPRVARWMREPSATRGPRPLCTARVAELMDEARRLVGR